MAFRLSKGSTTGKYFYQKDGVTYGPVTLEELSERVRPDSLVYYEGIQWTVASKLPELGSFKPPQEPTPEKSSRKTMQPPPPASDPPPPQEPAPDPVGQSEKSSAGKKVAVASLLLLAVCTGLGYYFWYRPYLKDKNALRMYSYASSLVLRSSPVSGVDYNEVGNLTYGTEVLVYNMNGEWATCKGNGTEGFASGKYLLSSQDFHIMNSIFTDQVTRDAVPTAKCKKALLMYYRQKGFTGKIDEAIRQTFSDSTLNGEVWQLIARNKDLKPNNVFYGRVVSANSKFTDFGCVIANAQTGTRRFLLFTFNDMEDPALVAEQDAPAEGYIANVVKVDSEGYSTYNVTYAQ